MGDDADITQPDESTLPGSVGSVNLVKERFPDMFFLDIVFARETDDKFAAEVGTGLNHSKKGDDGPLTSSLGAETISGSIDSTIEDLELKIDRQVLDPFEMTTTALRVSSW